MNTFRKAVNRFFDLVGIRNFFLAVGFLAAIFSLILAEAFSRRGAGVAGGMAVFGGLCMVAAAIVHRGEGKAEGPEEDSEGPEPEAKAGDDQTLRTGAEEN